MRQTLMTRKDEGLGEGSFDSIAWAMEVHVKAEDIGVYNAAILYGNEDCPSMIDFFRQEEPKVDDIEDYRWIPGGE